MERVVLRCPQKNTILTIFIDKDNEDLSWKCLVPKRKWPDYFKKKYAKISLEVAKSSKTMSDLEKLRIFLESYGLLSNNRGLTAVTRGLSFLLSREQQQKTAYMIIEAEKYFGVKYNKEQLIPEFYKEQERNAQLTIFNY